MPEATRALAYLAMTEQRIPDAKRYFSDLRGEPRYRSEAFYYLGRLAESERDFLAATRSYARVVEGTHAVEAQLRTARIMFAEQNDREGAVRHLRDFGEANPRFIVTNVHAAFGAARFLYESVYCQRGEMENRLKECQGDLFADRTPAPTMRANQLRLWLASFAYILMCAVRRIGLAGTKLEAATCGTIQLALLKIGALVTVRSRPGLWRGVGVAIVVGAIAAAPWVYVATGARATLGIGGGNTASGAA